MKIGFVSLGCPKNLVDTEVMMGQLTSQGHQLTSHPSDADVIVVNTCSFIDPAKQESVDTILEMAEYKKTGRAKRLIVAGCLVERFRGEIQKNLPDVDALIGTNEAGKTNVLTPLWKLNPAKDGEIDPIHDYPRKRYNVIREMAKVDGAVVGAGRRGLHMRQAVRSCLGLLLLGVIAPCYLLARRAAHYIPLTPSAHCGASPRALDRTQTISWT